MFSFAPQLGTVAANLWSKTQSSAEATSEGAPSRSMPSVEAAAIAAYLSSSYLPGNYNLIQKAQLNSSLHRRDVEGIGCVEEGRIVNVVEVAVTGDRIRGRLECPAGCWISLVSTDGEHKWAQQTEPGTAATSSSPSVDSSYLPGSYKLIRQAQLNSSLHRKDPEGLSIFDKGRIVNVVEVGVTGDRIRGRVDYPAGWISLASRDGKHRWVQVEYKPPSVPAPPTVPESKPKGPSGPASSSPEGQQAKLVERKASAPSADLLE